MALLCLLSLLFAPSHAAPVDVAWFDIRDGADAAADPIGDGVSPGPGGPSAPGTGLYAVDALDLVGTVAQGALAWTADDDAVYLRLTLVGSPLLDEATTLGYVWGVVIDGDQDGALDLALVVEPPVGTLRAYTNPGRVPGVYPGYAAFSAPVALGDLASGHVYASAGPGYFTYLHLVIPRETLHGFGVSDTTSWRVAAVTGASVAMSWVDIAPCNAFLGACSAIPATGPVEIDADVDGLTFPQERARGTSPTDADTDDDGLLDGEEPAGDLDGDGFDNALACDADADGLPDGLEAGRSTADLTAATDLSKPCFISDQDPLTVTDPWSEDSDGGGLTDGLEDANRNGRVDDWETDPRDPTDDADTDSDGIADGLERRGADGSVDDDDSDGDGIPDAVERLADPDGDGMPAFLDLDSDGDGASDAEEGAGDVDGDGVPNFLDLDSDGDGVPDAVEVDLDHDGVADDSDSDGTPDFLEVDSDGDGVPDAVEADWDGDGLLDDFDGDGVPDLRDLDSDGDGVPDAAEGEADTDRDGVSDRFDDDSDGDGIPDAVELLADPDGDQVPAFQDTNADGDRLSDRSEGTGDVDCDGLPNYVDPDDEDGFCTPGQPIPGVDTSEEPPEPARFLPKQGGCATAPAAPGGFALGLVAALWRRRRR